MKRYLIAISGKYGSGKDTFLDYMCEHNNYRNIVLYKKPLAEKLKTIATNGFGWDGEKDIRGRELLITLGKAGVKYDPYLWCRYSYQAYDEAYLKMSEIYNEGVFALLINDLRFYHQLEYFKNVNDFDKRIFLRIEREMKKEKFHDDISETELDNCDEFTYYIQNNGTEEELKEEAKKVYFKIFHDFICGE